ncbi:MAG: hypothetical protein WC248_07340, partial [Candidatus Methanomethylophilaceae archaeon]
MDRADFTYNTTLASARTEIQSKITGYVTWHNGTSSSGYNTLKIGRVAGSGNTRIIGGHNITAVYVPLQYEIRFTKSGTTEEYDQWVPSSILTNLRVNTITNGDSIYLGWKSNPGGNAYADEAAVVNLISCPEANINATDYFRCDVYIIMEAQWGNYSVGSASSITVASYAQVSRGDYVDYYYNVTLNDTTNNTLQGVYATYSSGPLSGKSVVLDKDPNPSYPNGYILPYVAGQATIHGDILRKIYTITYSYSGWTCSPTAEQQTLIAGVGKSFLDLPVPTRTDYIFEGWTYSGTLVRYNSLTGVTGNITLSVQGYYKKTTSYNQFTSGSSSSNIYPTMTSTAYYNTSQYTTGDSTASFSYSTMNWGSYGSFINFKDSSICDTDVWQYRHAAMHIPLTGDALKAYMLGATIKVTVSAAAIAAADGRRAWFTNYNARAGATIGVANGYSLKTGTSAADNASSEIYKDQDGDGWGGSYGTITSAQLTLNQPSFTIQLRGRHSDESSSASGYNTQTGWQSIRYSIDISGKPTEYTVTLNGNGGTRSFNGTSSSTYAIKVANSANFKANIPFNLFSRTNYFSDDTGWATSSGGSPSGTYYPGASIQMASSPTIYSVWYEKGYTVASWDVLTGNNSGVAYRVRPPEYRKAGTDFTTSNVAASGLDYTGFTRSGTYGSRYVINDDGVSGDSAHNTGSTLTSILGSDTDRTSQNAYCLIWVMNAPTPVGSDYNGLYGHSVELDPLANVSLTSMPQGSSYKIASSVGAADGTGWKKGGGAYITTNPGFLYEHVESSAADSQAFNCTIWYSWTYNGKTLWSKTGEGTGLSSNITVNIQPIVLSLTKKTEPVGGYAYNGFDQLTPYAIAADSTQIVGSQAEATSVFGTENASSISIFGAAGKGLSMKYVYVRDPFINIANDYPTIFRDAGTYTISSATVKYFETSNENKNYVFRIVAGQSGNTGYNYVYSGTTYTRSLYDGTNSVIMQQASLDVSLYYATKTYSSNSPTKRLLTQETINQHSTLYWDIYIDGLLGAD